MEVLVALGLLKAITKLSAGKCTSHKCLEGRTAIVTNSRNGIGYEVVQNLSMRGCKVILADIEDTVPILKKKAIRRNCKNVFYRYLDLSSLDSVRSFVTAIKSSEPRLDILINNANFGGQTGVFTDDGILKVIQVNFLGHFLLTHLLVDLLKQTPNSRIVFVTSILAFLSRLKSAEELNQVPTSKNVLVRNYIEYNNSKLCAAAAAKGFAERLHDTGIICNAAYPGLVYLPKFAEHGMEWNSEQISNKAAHGFFAFLVKIYGKTMYEGSQTILHCAIAKEVERLNGKFFIDCRQFRGPQLSTLKEFRLKLWEVSEKLVKLAEEEKLQFPSNNLF